MADRILIIILLGFFLSPLAIAQTPSNLDPPQVDKRANSFTLISEDFLDKKPIPSACVCERLGGQNRPPILHWSNAPKETNSFALIMLDETIDKGDKATRHWSVFNIPASILNTQNLFPLPSNTIEGINNTKRSGYEGPCPSGNNIYTFTVFALNKNMPAISQKKALTRSQFEREYTNFIIDSATLTGTYKPSKIRSLINRIKRKVNAIRSK